jgi:hypothetical protein
MIALFPTWLLGTDIKGDIGLQYHYYDHQLAPSVINRAVVGAIELEQAYESLKALLKLEALKDAEQDNRHYMKLNEAHLTHELGNYDIRIGKDIKFWGALELHNPADIYNRKNTEYDALNKDKKLGALGTTLRYFFDNDDELTLIAGRDKSLNRYFAKYSGTAEAIDFSLIAAKESDSRRLITYGTYLSGDTLYKLELSSDTDHYQSGVGLEHTLYRIGESKKDLGVLAEYYKSTDKTLPYQDDLFTGVRLTFNDTHNSDIVAGMIRDLDSHKNSYSFEYNTRLFDAITTAIRYMYSDTLKATRIEMGYYF